VEGGTRGNAVTSGMFVEGERWREWGKTDVVEGVAAMALVRIWLTSLGGGGWI
jgi:hypothetical protein